jgi:hypothetical protein
MLFDMRTWKVGLVPIVASVLFGVAGCTGLISDPGERAGEPSAPGPTRTGEPPSPRCAPTVDPGPRAPLVRLTRVEYNRTVRDLLGDTTAPANAFPAEEELSGTDVAGPITDAQFELYQSAAETLAATAVRDNEELRGCADLSGEACARRVLRDFGRRAYRRPLTDAELERAITLFQVGDADGGWSSGVELAVTAMLQSPSFLYRLELSGSGVVRPLDGYERATRMSYFLWGSTPDEALLDAAAAGDLDEPTGVVAHAERMLDDPRAAEQSRAFFVQWLELDLGTVQKATSVVSDFEPLRRAIEAERDAFLDHVMWQSEGTLGELLSATYTFVDAETAPLYGVAAPASGERVRVELDPGRRSGILTMLPVLVAHAAPTHSAPIQRGVFIRERLLCGDLPAPPDDIDPPDVDESVSARERLAQHRSDPACAGCHTLIDPLGLPFESYDTLGRFRTTTAAGEPIDVSGEVSATEHSDGPVAHALELTQRLAESPDVAACVTRSFFASAVGRPPSGRDGCSVDGAALAFERSDRSFTALLLALVQSDAFLYQSAAQEVP